MQDLTQQVFKGDPISPLTGASMAAGNMMSSNDEAMTAPGSKPTDPLPDRDEQGDPKITASSGPAVVRGGRDHHPSGGYRPGTPAWKNTH
jgi:hypothetical protein